MEGSEVNMDDKYMIQPVEETRAVIFDSTIDLSMDISEIYLDMLSDDGVIKDIPALSTVYKIGKTVYSISQLAYIKKTIAFAQELQRNDIGQDVLEKHKVLMISNPKKYYKELELIIEYLDKQIGYEKSVLSGRVYYLLLSEEIGYNDFVLMMETINQIHLSDKKMLEKIYREGKLSEGDWFDKISCVRLHNCGLIYYNNTVRFRMEKGKAVITMITEFGEFFCEAVLHIEKGNNV